MVIFNVERWRREGGRPLRCRLMLCDLAGSERQNQVPPSDLSTSLLLNQRRVANMIAKLRLTRNNTNELALRFRLDVILNLSASIIGARTTLTDNILGPRATLTDNIEAARHFD